MCDTPLESFMRSLLVDRVLCLPGKRGSGSDMLVDVLVIGSLSPLVRFVRKYVIHKVVLLKMALSWVWSAISLFATSYRSSLFSLNLVLWSINLLGTHVLIR